MSMVVTILLLIPSLSIKVAATIVILGMVIGELASLLYLHYHYNNYEKNKSNCVKSFAYHRLVKNILKISIPITLTRLISSLIIASNSILIPRRLMAGGLSSSEAIGTYGIIAGMVMPLLFLPFTLISALSIVIIPNLSENIALKNWTDIRNKVSKSIMISSLTAFSSMAIIIPLANPIGAVIYKQVKVGLLLTPLAYSMIFFCLQQNLNSILNGLGKQNRAAFHFLIGGSVQLICTYVLVANPKYGIYGFVIGFTLSSIIVSTLNFIAVISYTKLTIKPIEWFLKPGFAALVVALITRFMFLLLIDEQISYGISLFIAGCISIILLGIVLFSIGSLNKWIIIELRNKFRF